MAQKPQHDGSYDKARKLTENALDAYAKGNPQQGDKLVDQAQSTNRKAVQEVAEELEEDKSADHESFVASEGDKPEDAERGKS